MRTDITKTFENMLRAAQWAGIDTTGLCLETGNSTYARPYRVYRITDPCVTRKQESWPYSPPDGFLGITRGEAIKTLDIMRYVFQGIGYVKDEQERQATK